VIVGTLMFRNVREINWDYFGDAVPAFLTIITIPLTYKYAHQLSGNLTWKKIDLDM
jgi:adenine/guanine/hypoxanthine permease